MNRKLLTIISTVALALLVGVCGAYAKKGDGTGGGGGTSGPPEEPTVVPKYIWMEGTVALVEEVYELKETLIVYDYDDNVWVEKLVPIADPDSLYFLTVVGDQDVDGDGDGVIDFELKDGDQWLLDFGPEWYAADPCLVESYICEEGGGLIKVGPFVLGDFTCNGLLTDSVVSTDPSMAEASISLMSGTRRDALPEAGFVYAFGRSGGSEIVWIWDPDGDGEFERYPKAGSNILWEVDDGGGQAWWRGEAPPQAMTSELSCAVAE